jgi:16S rRNA (adenine1518-N6/adenine1519-N6)-dimethyltransferase
MRAGGCDREPAALAPRAARGRLLMAAYPSPRALLEKYGLRAKKSWGQNFLGDEEILDHIARLAVEVAGERVVELGAGLGHLTARLVARGARVVAVERDRDMAAVLRGEFGERVALLEADAARLDYRRLLANWPAPGPASASATPTASEDAQRSDPSALSGAPPEAARSRRAASEDAQRSDPSALSGAPPEAARSRRAARLCVVGNLPYHLTSPILFTLLDEPELISRAVFLVQREVAERLAAEPGTKEWGLLSVLLQHRADVSVERRVPAGAFLPPPKVESAVLRAAFRPPRAAIADEARFRRLVKAGFGQRRKVLANALAAGRVAAPEALAAALAAAHIDPRRRGETLTVEEWASLDRALGSS